MSPTPTRQQICVLDNISKEDLICALRNTGLVVDQGCLTNVLVITRQPLRFPADPNVIDLAVEQYVRRPRSALSSAGADLFNGNPDDAA